MLHGAVVASLPSQQTLDADFARFGFVGPLFAVGCNKTLAVVLVHPHVDALLGIWGCRDEVDPEAGIHGASRSSLCTDHGDRAELSQVSCGFEDRFAPPMLATCSHPRGC